MNYKDTKQTQQTNDWLARNGINGLNAVLHGT